MTVLAYGPMVRTCAAGRGGRRRGGPVGRGHRPALAVARWTPRRSSPRSGETGRCVVVHEAAVTGGLGAEIAARVTEECFYPAGGAGAAGRRLLHPVPAVPAGGACTCPTWTGCSTPSTAPSPSERSQRDRCAAVPAPRRRRGTDRGGDRPLARAAWRPGHRQPDHRRDRDRQGRRRAALPVRRGSRRAACAGRRDRRRRHADHRGEHLARRIVGWFTSRKGYG